MMNLLKNKKADVRLKFFLSILIILLMIGIVLATYAFPGANSPNTVLVSQACNTEVAQTTSETFTSACTTTSIDTNNAVTQTATVSGNNQYMGIRTQNYNSSTTSCGGITNVKLCYEWWSSSASIGTCTVKVDADGGTSYTTASATCPGTGANPGEICTDVTALESWTCNSFFGSSGTKALAYLQVISTTGGAKTLTADDLYFNVTYTVDNVAPVISIVYPANITYTSLPLTLNTSISDTNLQACWWSNNSGTTNRTFTCNTNVSLGNNISSGSNTLKVWANDSYGNLNSSSVTFNVNFPPAISNATILPNPVAGSTAITIYANSSNNVSDTEQATLYFYCDDSSLPDSVNTKCTGGTTSSAAPYTLTCGFTSQSGNGNYTKYCRVYDGNSYSSTVQVNYTVNADTLTTSIVSVAGDTTPSYYDTVNDALTEIIVSGESGMSCRWSSSDLAYSSMSNTCPVVNTQANCSVNNVASQGFATRYVSCQNALGVGQTASNNLDVSFYLDYTAPTTSDNSVSSIQLPNYAVTISEADSVDSDPKSYYCSSTSQGCNPTTSIDNGGQIVLTTRGVNYLRYYSQDFVGNSQTIVNKTINLNQLPVLTSASDNAVTILGGTTVTINSVSSDADSQTLKLYVCSSSGANSSGCTGTQYCSATATVNLSCGFASEIDSATHTWYAYLFDSLGEAASANPLTGSYITDSTAPSITIISPENTNYTQTSVTTEIVTSEAASSAWYNLDSNSTTNVTLSNVSSKQWTAVISGLLIGNHNITFYANDSFDNLGSSSIRYFTIVSPADTTPPAITILTPANASYNSLSPLLNITTDEALSWAGYKLNSGALTNLTNSSTTNWYATLSLSQESTNNLTIYVNDTSNNQNNKTIIFYADTLAPRYSNAGASPSSANQSQSVTCSINWTDGFNITSVIIGENSLGSYENHTISFSGTSGTASYLILGTKLANKGTYNCIFYATDIVGNLNSTNVSFNINDVISPTLTIISPLNSTYNTDNISISILTSEAAGSTWYSLDSAVNVSMGNTSSTSWNASLTSLSEGSHNIIFYANDSSNNIGNSSRVYFSVNTALGDTIPPVITIDTITNASYKTSTTVGLNITTNENTVWAGYKLNSGSLTNMSNSSTRNWNVTLSSLGTESTNNLIIYANDTSNNQGNTTITFYVDTIAPRFLNVSASPSVANETQSVVCNAYVNDTFALGSVKIAENSSGTFVNHTIDLYSAGYANYTMTNVQKGGYACIFYAKDAALNENSTSTTFTVNDVTPPVISINSPLNQSYSTNSILLSITTNENLTSANYSLDGGVTNVSLIGTEKSWSKTLSFSDGSKTLILYGVDSSGNLGTNTINFVVDTSVNDITPPTITIRSPINSTYYTSASVLLNITTGEALSWAGYSNNSNTIYNLGNISTTNWNKTLTLAEGAHNITFFANDSSTNKNQANKSTIIYVDLNNPSVNSFTCTNPVNNSQDVNCSASVSDAVGLSYAIIGYNATGTWQNSSQISLSGTSSSLSYIIAAGNTTMPGFNSQIYLYDSSGRGNLTTSYNINITDDSFPQIYNISYTPNTTAELDPGVTVNISADIVEDYQISNVKLMYKNSSAISWTSLSMSNTTLTNYNASITLGNETWYFKINATDSAGNSNISSNYTLVVENDTRFYNSTTIPDIKSYTLAQETNNNPLGLLYLNNTGDTPLNFSIVLSSTSLNGKLSINYTGNSSMNYSVSSGNAINISVEVNSVSLPTGLYDYSITINSNAGTQAYSKQVYIQTAAGPYLVASIDTYSSSVTRGQSGVELVASVKNLGTSDATGVVLNWSLPSEFSLSNGNYTRNIGNLPIGVSSTNSLVIGVLSSVSSNTVNITAMSNSNENSTSNATKQINILDPLIVTITTPGTGGGGGGGGTAGAGGESIVYSKTIEIVRGEQDSFEIEINNKYFNSSLEDLTMTLDGFPSQYVDISPSKIDRINSKETKKFTVKLKIPSYKEGYEEHTLKAVISGYKVDGTGKISYTETQNIKLIIQEVSKEKSNLSLAEAEKAILEMTNSGFNTDEVNKLLEQAKNKLSENRNKEAQVLSEKIISIKDKAVGVDKLINKILEALKDPRKTNLLTGNVAKDIVDENGDNVSINSMLTGKVIFSGDSAESVLNMAIAAFKRGDYATAEERAKSSQVLLLLERKGNFGLFLYLYWHFVLIGFVLLTMFGIFSYKTYQKSAITGKIQDIDKEEDNIRGLILSAQRNYFSGKISVGEYHRVMSQHQNKLAKIKQERLNLRNKRIKMLKPQQILQDLVIERIQVENEIKKVQEQFYRDRKISESEYNTEFKILNERLAEIEGERITFEMLKKNESGKIQFENTNKELERAVIKSEKEFKKQGRVRIFFLKIIGFIKYPFYNFSKMRENKRAREEAKIREKIKRMNIL
ncbi:hypothetical protein HYW76_00215 [Candidatus Pacearchaeota archaeon]|nr:hypothetical protein [Candidatus Pacearchaeota archaeon]